MKKLFIALLLVALCSASSLAGEVGIIQSDCQERTISGTSAATTNAVKADRIALYATTDCFVKLGTAPVATVSGTGNIFVPANTYIGTSAQQTDKVAVISTGGTGTLYVYSLR